jgi:hypothetical protein
MASTSEMTREERKAAKRKSRKELKGTYGKFTKEQIREFRGKNIGGVKGFLAGTNEEND